MRADAAARASGIPDPTPSLEAVRPFTMVHPESLADLAYQVIDILTYDVPGDFVECGVWRGGAAFLIADLLRRAGRRDRKVWLFDSFEGLPAPQQIDGSAALEYAASTDSPGYFDNCRASLEEVRGTAAKLGLTPYTECIKGWFEDALPTHRDRIGRIALLRIDCDWHASVRCCLDSLYDNVAPGGFITIDDYYTYDGCARAVHEFLGERGLVHRIQSVVGESDDSEYCQCAVFRKGSATWDRKWIRRLHLAMQEIERCVPAGSRFILADEGRWGAGGWAGGRRSLPFPERDGQYSGPPADDEAAVRELERLRRAGAGFLVVAWPAFWWLDHYQGLREQLQSRFPRSFESERVVVFDLRS